MLSAPKVWSTGAFLGLLPSTRWQGPLDYVYEPDAAPNTFSFARSGGTVLCPETMDTDGGTIPRFLWSLPNLDPWTYFPAYLLHDWLYDLHHRGDPRALSFDETNAVLMEAISTLVANKQAPAGPHTLQEIYLGVSGAFGELAWIKSAAALETFPIETCWEAVKLQTIDDAALVISSVRNWIRHLGGKA